MLPRQSLHIEEDAWRVEWTAAGIESIRLRDFELLAAPARPTAAGPAAWQVEVRGERGVRVQPETVELTQALVWPFRYEPGMEVVVRGTDLMPLALDAERGLGNEFTVLMRWPSTGVAISIAWDPDRLPSATITLKAHPDHLELMLPPTQRRDLRPTSWWVQVRDSAAGKPIEVVDYNAAWPEQFEIEKARVMRALGDLVVALEHGGSTSVPGLEAKPVIDVWLALRAPLGAEHVEAMAAFGYEHLGEAGLEDRDFFVKQTPPPVNLHCYPAGHPQWARHLAFRDWLRTHPAGARAYGTLKRALALRFPGDRLAYTEAKSDFIEAALAGKVEPDRR